jgi:hypothetical protein
MEYLDKWLILDDIIPFLPQIQSREPAVLMSIVGRYGRIRDCILLVDRRPNIRVKSQAFTKWFCRIKRLPYRKK